MSSKKKYIQLQNIIVTKSLKELWEEYQAYVEDKFYKDLDKVKTQQDLQKFLVEFDFGELIEKKITVDDKKLIIDQFEKDYNENMKKMHSLIKNARKMAFEHAKSTQLQLLQNVRTHVQELKEIAHFQTWLIGEKYQYWKKILDMIKQ